MALNKAELMEVPGGPGVVGAISGGTGISVSGTGTISVNPAANVTRIIAGTNCSITPTSGYGNVTINFTAGAGSAEVPTGSVMYFFQASAPTGWTQVTTYDNYTLRVVSGTGGGTGGSRTFTQVFTSQTVTGTATISGVSVSGTVGAVAVSQPQLGAHSHQVNLRGQPSPNAFFAQPAQPGTIARNPPTSTSSNGSSSPHTHTATGATAAGTANYTSTAINLAVKYIDAILCQKA